MLDKLQKYGYGSYSALFPVKSIPLRAMIAHCGYQCNTTRDYYWDGLRRGSKEFGIWQYTLAGHGKLRFENKYYDLNPGDLMLLTVPHNHCYWLPEDSEKWELVFLSMAGREILRIWRELIKRFGPVIKMRDGAKCLDSFIEFYGKAIRGGLESPFEVSNFAYRIAMELLDDLRPGTFGSNEQPEFITKAVNYCMEHYSEDIMVEDLADIAGVSRYHFSRIFRQHQGVSPAAFVNDLKIKAAVRMLQMELFSVKEIAYRCGFNDVSYFCKVFKKVHGLSPAEFRNISWNEFQVGNS